MVPPQSRPRTDPFRQGTDYSESDEGVDDGFSFSGTRGHTPPAMDRDLDWRPGLGAYDELGAMQATAGEWSDEQAAAPSVEPEPEVQVRQELSRRANRMDAPFELQELSTKERHQLLMHTIQLYDDRWKLAGVRANERKNRLEAYLVPRNKPAELKEAMSRNQALIIYIDSRGNTDVREPKKRSLLRRFATWLFGA